MDGFDMDSPLVCEGIIGDGCGGGRIFHIKENALFVYDKTTQKSKPLLENIFNAKKLSKSACIITIECIDEVIRFDLSLMKRV
jgi:hypothetical protein